MDYKCVHCIFFNNLSHNVDLFVILIFNRDAKFAIISCKGSKGNTQDERSRLESDQQRFRPVFNEETNKR